MPDTPTVTPLVERIAEILDTERAFRLYYSDDGRTRVAEKIAAALRSVEADDAGLIERLRGRPGDQASARALRAEAADRLASLSAAKVEAEKEVERLRERLGRTQGSCKNRP